MSNPMGLVLLRAMDLQAAKERAQREKKTIGEIISDLYLLALAVRHQVGFVTFDTGIPLAAVRNATMHNLVVL